MGRSSLQGTPWHYEYLSPSPRKDKVPSYCRYVSAYKICQNKQSLFYGDECPTYMRHRCKFRNKPSNKSQKPNKAKHNNVIKNKIKPKQIPNSSQSIKSSASLSQISALRKKHSKYFKNKIKPSLQCPKCKSANVHRYQMEYKHGYAVHYLTCHVCKHEWEQKVDDSLIV